ncbi:MAG: FHA domain-containing protein [Pseudomonadota bacterium]
MTPDAEGRYYLTALEGPLKGREFVIVGGEVRIGRTRENDIVIEDRNLSRHHASLWVEKGALWIADHESKNGILVNRERITSAELRDADVVQLGSSVFRVGIDTPENGGAALGRLPGQLGRLKEAARKMGYRRIALYGTVLCVLAYVFSTFSTDAPKPIKVQKRNSAPVPMADVAVAPLRASADEVTQWQRQAELALRYDDMPAAIPLLRKVVAAKPHDPLPRAQLARAQQHLSTLIQQYVESGVREYQKMYYDRAVQEWQKVLALSENFAPDTYRETESKIREARAKLTEKR